MFGGVAFADYHGGAGYNSNNGDDSGLPVGMTRRPGGNSGAICGGSSEGGLGINILGGFPLFSDRALKTDVTPVVWS